MKIDRLVSIIMILNNKERVTTKELSERFEVSRKTIQRDIEIIEKAGVPIVAYKGHRGGYSLIEGYKVNKTSMTKEEAGLVNMLLLELNKSYENVETMSLINKLGVVHTESNNLSDRLVIDFSRWGKKNELNAMINVIDRAILNRNPIEFHYINGDGESTTRIVDPYKIIFKSLDWYMYGYCNLKKEMRIFKVNRIRDIKIRKEKYVYRDEDAFNAFEENEPEKTPVTVRFNSEFKNIILETFQVYREIEVKNNHTTAIVGIPYSNWVVGMFLSFGENIEVLSPEFLRDKIKGKIEAMGRIYKKLD